MLEAVIGRLKLEFYALSEYIIYQDDQSTEMYFIVEVAAPVLAPSFAAPFVIRDWKDNDTIFVLVLCDSY